MISKLREVVEYRDFFVQLVSLQLRQRYQYSVLGFLWTLVNPILVLLSFTVIFSYINHQNMREYGIYFFSGYLPWTFFANTSSAATESVVGNASYITRIHLPAAILPLASVALNIVDLFASLLVLAIVMTLAGAKFSGALLILPVSIFLIVVFVSGVALLFSVFNVFMRDFRHLLTSMLFIGFFLSPVLFKLESLPMNARRFFAFNPMVPFLNLFQLPISRGRLPSWEDFAAAALIAITTLFAAAYCFFRSENRFYYYV
ncbi:MAG: ABC transporter permease [Acidobacteriota bacterium]|nr:ABC transporter permease [Acidobacteriota bacterium]